MQPDEKAGTLLLVVVADVYLESRLRSYMLSLSFSIGEELLCLVGRSGSGKTAILRAIAGVFIPDSGTITIRDRQVFNSGLDVNLPPGERHVGYVPQTHALFPHLPIAENIAFPMLKHSTLSDVDVQRRVEELMDLLALDQVADRLPEHVDPVLRGRAAVARALALDPELLLMDDPYATLDDATRREARADFTDLRRRLGIPCVFATAELEEAYEISDRIALIDEGRLLQIDPPRTLLLRPASRKVAELVRSVNVIPGEVVEVKATSVVVTTELGSLRVDGHGREGELVDLVIRPEHVRIVDTQGENDERENLLSLRVSEQDRHGDIVALTLASPDAAVSQTVQAFLSETSFRDLGEIGERVLAIYLPPRALHVMPRLPSLNLPPV